MKGRFFREAFAGDGKKRPFYLVFTLLFIITALCCFSWFIFSGRFLIWKYDGWEQHYRALVYYAQYLKDIVHNLVTGNGLVIPDWDFYIGEGSDVVNTLSYYAIGDPIALLSVFVPMRYMNWFYSVAAVARVYLAGISFCVLCFGTGRKDRCGIMAGALGYCFCGWVLLYAPRHPFFISPMILFPLMILGMEKILRKERPYLWIITTAVSAACQFYFFYMIVILSVIYAVIRVGFLYKKQIAKSLGALLHLGITAFAGVCLAAVIFLPVLVMYARDSRTSIERSLSLVYPLSFYSALPASLFTNGQNVYNFGLYLGYAAPVILAVFLLFLKKKEKPFLKSLIIVCLVLVLIPFCARLMNGMSYAAHRWSWAAALLCMYILAVKWNDLMRLTKKEWRRLVIICAVFYGMCLCLDRSRDAAAFASLTMMFITLIILRGSVWRKQAFTLAMVPACAFVMTVWMYSSETGKYVGDMTQNDRIEAAWEDNEAAVVKELSDPSEYARITGRYLSVNTSMFNDVSSTQYYWSISNPWEDEFRAQMEFNNPVLRNRKDYDDRSAPTALSSIQYYVTRYGDTAGIPWGFTYLDTVDTDTSGEEEVTKLKDELGVNELSDAQKAKITEKTKSEYIIYKNEQALPLGYCYDTYCPKEVWDQFDPVQKQEAFLETACVEEDPEGIAGAGLQMSDYKVPFKIECKGTEISQVGSSFVATGKNTKVVLTLTQPALNAETYLELKGIRFTETPEYDLYSSDRSVDPLELYNETYWGVRSKTSQQTMKREKTFWNPIRSLSITLEPSVGRTQEISYYHPDGNFFSGLESFIANFGFREEAVTTITITFPERGVYAFEELNVYAVPMDDFGDKIAKLGEDTLEDITLGTDTVTGTISLDETKLLCLSVPYSEGWEAFIDGEKTRVCRVNIRHQGIVVPAGEHTIELRYHTPYKREGAALSALTAAVLIALAVWDKKKRRAFSKGDPDQ